MGSIVRLIPQICTTLLLAVAFGTVAAQQPAASEAALTNTDVVTLMKLDLGDEVIIAKVHQAPAVNFDLSPDGIAKLMNAGISKEVIAAMLKRATPSSPQPQPTILPPQTAYSFWPQVRIRSKDGEVELTGRRGVLGLSSFILGWLHYLNFPGATSKIVAKNPRPEILARLLDDPRDRQGRSRAFLVKLESDKSGDKRSLKIGQLSTILNTTEGGLPDSDWTVQFDAKQESPGIWRITPEADLTPGEYGLYISSFATLYDFSVDK